jgi:hypothetical protein
MSRTGLAYKCGVEAYRLSQEPYKKECVAYVKYLRRITKKQLSIQECAHIVYQQLKIYKKIYVRPLAKQILKCEREHQGEEAKQRMIRNYFANPILSFDVVNQRRIEEDLPGFTAFTDDLTTLYSKTPEFEEWFSEWNATHPASDSDDDYENEENTSTASSGNIPAGRFNQGLTEAELRQRQRAQAEAERVPVDDPNKPPNAFICPFTTDIMENPIVLSDGVSYDASMLDSLFAQPRPANPITGEALNSEIQIPNKLLKHIIDTWIQTKQIDPKLLRFKAPMIDENGRTIDAREIPIDFSIMVPNLNIKLLINENINPRGAVQEIKDAFRQWSSTLGASASKLLFDTTDQYIDLLVSSGLTIMDVQRIIESFQHHLTNRFFELRNSADDTIISKAWDDVRDEMILSGQQMKVFKYTTIKRFEDMYGIEGENILNFLQGQLFRDYFVEDPKRLLTILQTSVDYFDELLQANTNEISDEVLNTLNEMFEQKMLEIYTETATPEEQQHKIPQRLIDRTREYIKLSERYGIPCEREALLFVEIKTATDGITPRALVESYRFPLEREYEIPFEVIFVGIENARRHARSDIDTYIKSHITNLHVWLGLANKRIGFRKGNYQVPLEVWGLAQPLPLGV